MEENHQNNLQPGGAQTPIQTNNFVSQEIAQPVAPSSVLLTWTAKEFIEREKSANWLVIFIVGLVVVSVGLFFLLHSIFSIVITVLMGVIFAIVAFRKPKIVKYELNNHGVVAGSKANYYSEFKSFSVIDEDGTSIGSIVLNPFKRFVFPVSLYYDLSNENEIVNILAQKLPIEDPKKDRVDQLMRKLHF